MSRSARPHLLPTRPAVVAWSHVDACRARPGPLGTWGLLAVVLLVSGCAGTSDSEVGATTSSASTSTASDASTSSQPSPPAGSSTSAPAGSTIDVSFAGGQVSGDTGRISVPSGDQVTIKVASDVADEIHLHGYDLSAPVGPGTPGTLTFPATIPGVFEVELEQRGTLLFTLQVG